MFISIFENVLWHQGKSCWFVNPFVEVVATTKIIKNAFFGKSATLSIIGTTFVGSCIWDHNHGFNPMRAVKCGLTGEYPWQQIREDALNSFSNKDYQDKTYYKWGIEPKKKIIVINLKK